MVICEVLLIHINEEYLDSEGKLDPMKLDLVARMGGNWYSRTTENSMFEIPKPNRSLGMGVDQLPEHIRLSPYLTGNELGRLGNLTTMPTPKEIEETKVYLESISKMTGLSKLEKKEQNN